MNELIHRRGMIKSAYSVVFNQLVLFGDLQQISTTGTEWSGFTYSTGVDGIFKDKYYSQMLAKGKPNSEFIFTAGNNTVGQFTNLSLDTFIRIGGIFTCVYEDFNSVGLWDIAPGGSGESMTGKDAVCFNVTQMFGAGNEPTSVAEFKTWLAENNLDGYQPYNEGEIRYTTKPSWIQ